MKMENEFRLEVDTGHGGYGFDTTLEQLLEDVKMEYGEDVELEVKEWALKSKKDDMFHKFGMYIWNCGSR